MARGGACKDAWTLLFCCVLLLYPNNKIWVATELKSFTITYKYALKFIVLHLLKLHQFDMLSFDSSIESLQTFYVRKYH